jgi:hypothetical protein
MLWVEQYSVKLWTMTRYYSDLLQDSSSAFDGTNIE